MNGSLVSDQTTEPEGKMILVRQDPTLKTAEYKTTLGRLSGKAKKVSAFDVAIRFAGSSRLTFLAFFLGCASDLAAAVAFFLAGLAAAAEGASFFTSLSSFFASSMALRSSVLGRAAAFFAYPSKS